MGALEEGVEDVLERVPGDVLERALGDVLERAQERELERVREDVWKGGQELEVLVEQAADPTIQTIYIRIISMLILEETFVCEIEILHS